MSVKTCKCSHLKSEHKKGLCDNCPCCIFVSNKASIPITKFMKYLSLISIIILVLAPIGMFYSWNEIPAEIGDQIVMNKHGKSISYGHILLLVMMIISLVSLIIASIFWGFYREARMILNRKDYS